MKNSIQMMKKNYNLDNFLKLIIVVVFSGQIAIANPSTKGDGETTEGKRKRNGTGQKNRRQFNR